MDDVARTGCPNSLVHTLLYCHRVAPSCPLCFTALLTDLAATES